MLDQRRLRSFPSYPVAYRKSHSFRNLRRETRLNSHQKVCLGKDDVAPVERTKVARWPLCRLGGSQESQNGIGGFCILESDYLDSQPPGRRSFIDPAGILLKTHFGEERTFRQLSQSRRSVEFLFRSNGTSLHELEAGREIMNLNELGRR